MQAWIEGLTAIAEAFGPCVVLVYSDSQYVGYGVRNAERLRHANADLWAALDAVVAIHDHVEFQHVKGHAGDKYNEIVDGMASIARRTGHNT